MLSLQMILLVNKNASHTGKMFKNHIPRKGSVRRIYAISEPQGTPVVKDNQGTAKTTILEEAVMRG